MVLNPCKYWDILHINWWFQPSTVAIKWVIVVPTVVMVILATKLLMTCRGFLIYSFPIVTPQTLQSFCLVRITQAYHTSSAFFEFFRVHLFPVNNHASGDGHMWTLTLGIHFRRHRRRYWIGMELPADAEDAIGETMVRCFRVWQSEALHKQMVTLTRKFYKMDGGWHWGILYFWLVGCWVVWFVCLFIWWVVWFFNLIGWFSCLVVYVWRVATPKHPCLWAEIHLKKENPGRFLFRDISLPPKLIMDFLILSTSMLIILEAILGKMHTFWYDDWDWNHWSFAWIYWSKN